MGLTSVLDSESAISLMDGNPCQEQAVTSGVDSVLAEQWEQEDPRERSADQIVGLHRQPSNSEHNAFSPVISNFSVETFAFKLLCSS